MSLVIAIKDKNRIVLGADKQTSIGNNKDHLATKIWEVSDLPGALMGSVGSVRVSQILQYSELIDKNSLGEMPTFEFIVRSLVPIIRATLEGNGVRCSFPESEDSVSVMMPNSLLFAYKDRAWMIWHDFSVSEIYDYLAIGSGSDIAKGVLFATTEKNPFERIVTAIDAAAENTVYVDDGIDLLVTEEKSTDFKQFSKALGVEIQKLEVQEDNLQEKESELEEKKEPEKKNNPKKSKKTTKKKEEKES